MPNKPNLCSVLPYDDPEFDPFDDGRDVDTSDLPPPAVGGVAHQTRGFGPKQASSKKPPDHQTRTGDWLEKQGYFNLKTEFWCTDWKGTMFKRDLMGFADRLAWKSGTTFAVQIKNGYHNLNDALRDMCSEQEVKGAMKRTKLENLRAWLECGNRVFVICWGQPDGRHWEPRLTEVTMATVDEVCARKRKRAA